MKELIDEAAYWIFVEEYESWCLAYYGGDAFIGMDYEYITVDRCLAWEPIEEPDYDPTNLIHNQNLGAST